MHTTLLTRTQAVEVGICVAVLRGLYGDIGESLTDADVCRDLWSQAEAEYAQLSELMAAVIDAS
jgi:hypothetical protein